MTYNFNFIPQQNGLPFFIDYKASTWLSNELKERISVTNPLLEFRIANELASTDVVELTDEEKDYLIGIITQMQVPNDFKGLILQILNT